MDKIRVAIAEDSKISAEILKEIVKSDEKLEMVWCASNGMEACKLMEQTPTDVLLLDLVMPVMDGITVLEKLRNNPQKKDICPYIIVLSSVGNDRVTAEAFKDGADYYIRKPYDRELLLNRIKAYAEYENQTVENVWEKQVEDALHDFGVTSNLKGYRYLKDAVLLCLNDSSRINYITKMIYPDIADRYGTTVDCVERAMRHAIKIIWDKNENENRTVCGHVVSFDKNRPTNSELIAQLTMMCMETPK